VQRSVAWVFAALSAGLVLFPLTLGKPGLPSGLKSDEPAYLMMAESLAFDGDLRLEARDTERVFRTFPFRKVDNLILMSDDGWRTIHYGKPYLYSLFAAPFVRLFGANGLIAFNMALLLGMVGLGALYLARFNPPWLALLFASGFFLLSHAWSYVFWLHPEIFSMAAVTASLFFALHRFGASAEAEDPPLPRWQAAASGAFLALAAYNKPVYAAVGLPFLLLPLLRRRWQLSLVWAGGFALALGLAAGLAVAFTGHPTSYLGVRRQGVTLCEPGKVPIAVEAPASGAPPAAAVPAGSTITPPKPGGTGGSWSWVFTVPSVPWRELSESVGYFLLGRHTGLFVYAPFTLLALVAFGLYQRRDPERWLLLAGVGVAAAFFLLYIPANWQGGGGFVGNRYFVCLVPAFLFLARQLPGPPGVVASFALGGLLLGPVVFTPFGAGGPEPTLQSHVRNVPFRWLPLELTLREVPGYTKAQPGAITVQGRRDVFLPRGERFWVRGASRAELWITSAMPLERLVFEVRSFAPANPVRFRLGGEVAEVTLGADDAAGEAARVTLAPRRPDRLRTAPGGDLYLYELVIEARGGRTRQWTREVPPDSCGGIWAENLELEETFYVGAELAYLGDGSAFDADVYGVAWGNVGAPTSVVAGQRFEVPVQLTNTSAQAWTGGSSARVRLAYHWLEAAGQPLIWDGRRSELPLPLAPGAAATATLSVDAPATPGRYLLAIEPVHENVAWFSDRLPGVAWTAVVEVVAP
jgi:hypothetical protein